LKEKEADLRLSAVAGCASVSVRELFAKKVRPWGQPLLFKAYLLLTVFYIL
jgi:hypothetical protein